MRPLASRALPAIVMSLAVGWGVAGCSTDENGGNTGAGSVVIGTWDATTFNLLGTELIGAGMGIVFTFEAAGTYIFDVTNDQAGFCDVGTACTDGGDYTATATVITLDPGTTDATVLNYTISGNTMTVTALVEGAPITATFDKR